MCLIDADVLKKDLEPYGLAKGCTLGSHSGMAEILIDIVEKQPTIDAGPVRHGKWERKRANLAYNIYTCSNCGFEQWEHTGVGLDWNYCSNCGAKMG